jgi:hypothetical protein
MIETILICVILFLLTVNSYELALYGNVVDLTPSTPEETELFRQMVEYRAKTKSTEVFAQGW